MDYAKPSIKIQLEKERLKRFYEILLDADLKVLRDLIEERKGVIPRRSAPRDGLSHFEQKE